MENYGKDTLISKEFTTSPLYAVFCVCVKFQTLAFLFKARCFSYPRNMLKLCDSFRIRDECQTCASRVYDVPNIHIQLMCQVSQYPEYCGSSQQGGERVKCGYNHGVPATTRIDLDLIAKYTHMETAYLLILCSKSL